MTLFKKTILIVVGTSIILVFVLAAASGYILLEGFTGFEEKSIISYLMISLFAAWLVLCSVMLLFFRKTILARMSALGASVRRVCANPDFSGRLVLGDDRDEFDGLAANINSMLDSLETSRQQMRENEQRYRILFERAPDSIFVVAIEDGRIGRIVAANQAAIDQHGYTLDELRSMNMADLNTPESNEVSGRLTEQISRGEWVTEELWRRRKDGTSFPLEVHAGLVSVKGHNLFLCFDRDITARKKVEAADRIYMEQFRQINTELARKANDLEAANRELEAFNYSVSHDMRGPLTRISGYCQLMLDDAGNLEPSHREYLARIYESSCWLDEMIDAMLKLSQLVRAEFVPRQVDLSAVCKDALRELSMGEPDRLLEADISPGVIAEGDANLLKIALVNLVSNAWKYSSGREVTRIEFGVRNQQQQLVYYIRDNGVGFDMKDAGRLFRVFTRLHTQARFAGSGIGLATVQRIITRHGGKIWAEGEPDKGAVFFFTIGGICQETGS